MRTIIVKKKDGEFAGKPATVVDFFDLLSDSVRALREDGSVLFCILKNHFSESFMSRTIKTFERIGRDVFVSPYGSLEKSNNKLSSVGFFEKTFYGIERPCGLTEWTKIFPDEWKMAQELAREVWSYYSLYCPQAASRQLLFSDEFASQFTIPNTGFSTITLGKNNPREYHKDDGNLFGGMTVLTPVKIGKCLGAHLVFPEYSIALEVGHSDLVMFDSYELHGNTPLNALENSERWAVGYYFRENLKECGVNL
jgi:hypothetical protein